jgi:Na+/H+-dicarboxylate symporter
MVLPPAAAPVRQRAMAAFVIGALSLLAVPSVHDPRRGVLLLAFAVVFGMAAVWLGVTANRQARLARTARSAWAFGGVLLGIIAAGFGVLTLSVFAMLWPQLNTYFSCMNSANTVTVSQMCTNQFDKATEHEIGVP